MNPRPSIDNLSGENAPVSSRTHRVPIHGSALCAYAGTFTTAIADFIASATQAVPQSNAATGRYVWRAPKGSLLQVQMIGQGADNATGIMRIWGWEGVLLPSNEVQWCRKLLWDGSGTLSNDVGVAGGNPDANTRYADSFTTTTDRTLRDSAVISPTAADDHRADLTIDTEGRPYIEFEISCNGAGTDLTAIGVLACMLNGG